MSTVVVLGGNTGPNGVFKAVNIITAFSGVTGAIGFQSQSTGGTGPGTSTGPHGIWKREYNIGLTGPNGIHKTVVISGYSGPTGS